MSLKIGAAMKKKIISTVVALSVIGVSSFCVFNNMVSAVTKYYNEALTSSLVNCIDHGIFKPTVNAGTLNGSMWDFVTTVGTSVYTPLGFLNTAKDPSLVRTCGSIVQKIISNKGLSIPTSSSSEDTVDRFLKSLGYKKSSSSETQNNDSCFRLVYNSTDGSVSKEAYSKYICVKTDNKGNIIGNDVSVSGDGTVRIISVTGGSNSLTVKYNISGGGVEAWGGGTITVPIKSGGDSSFDGFKTRVKDAIIAAGASKGKYEVCYETGVCDTTNYDLLNAEGNANIQVGAELGEYTLTVDDASKRLITGTLMNSSIGTYPTFSQDEQFNMYQDYMNNYYKADVHCDWTADQAAQKVANDGYVEVTSCSGDGTTQPCYAKATTNEKRSVGGIDGNRHFGVDCDFNCVASWLKIYGSSNNPCPAVTTVDKNPTGSSGGYGGTDDLSCDSIVDNYVDGNVGAMQWILCPTMDNTRYTASWIDEMTDDWLTVPANIYGPGSPTETAWGSIRNIANILMVAFLLIIIFSQLTGYGIDNYGIKKMLPRLIVMAIIVNLSFYICVIAVDISNIAGQGLREMFGSLGPDTGVGGTNFLGGMITGIFATAGGATTAVGAGITLVSLGAPIAIAVIIAVIVLCLVILVAVVTLFLMLGVREIIVIFCILIAPLAFAAFILPNTQNMFKKWWNLFKSAIIIYPICGAVSGISYLLRSMSSNMELSMWGFAVLMILPYIGFFFIPMLLRESISALGKLGGALTSVGQTIKNGGRAIGQNAMRVAQNTEGFKNMQVEAARRRQSESSRRTIDKLEALKGQRELTNPETRRLARAHEVQRKLGMENEAARTILTEKEFANRSMTDLMNAWDKAFDDGDTDRMDALTNVIVAKHGPGGVNELAKRLGDKAIFETNPGGVDNAHPDGMRFVGGDNGVMAKSFNALQANMMQNKALATNMQNKASDAFQMISGGGYYTPDGSDTAVRGNLNMHSMYNSIATQTKDWATQSSATLKRAAEAGTLSKEVARNILNSTDPAIQSGIQSDASKRMVLQAAASGRLVTARNATKEAAHEAWSGKNANGNTNIEEAARYYRNFTAGGSI